MSGTARLRLYTLVFWLVSGMLDQTRNSMHRGFDCIAFEVQSVWSEIAVVTLESGDSAVDILEGNVDCSTQNLHPRPSEDQRSFRSFDNSHTLDRGT